MESNCLFPNLHYATYHGCQVTTNDLKHLDTFGIFQKHVGRYKYLFFDDFGILQLCHSYTYVNEGCYGNIDYKSVKYLRGKELYDRYFVAKEQVGAFGDFCGLGGIHAGALCIKREVLKDIRWKETSISDQIRRAEDYWFNMKTFEKFNKLLLIDAPIYVYRTPQ